MVRSFISRSCTGHDGTFEFVIEVFIAVTLVTVKSFASTDAIAGSEKLFINAREVL